MSVEEIIADAGRRLQTVQVKVENSKGQIEVFEVEPYMPRWQGGNKQIFCLDLDRYEYKSIDVEQIRAAEVTRRMFRPRFPIGF